MTAGAPPTLEVRDLATHIATRNGTVRAVDGVSFSLPPGTVFGLAGESGCGKSMTAHSIMRLLPNHAAIVRGDIRFKGTDLRSLADNDMRGLRGDRIAMVFQDPMTSLNPVFTIGGQIAEALRRHRGLARRQARRETAELLAMVGIPHPDRCHGSYPHEFSGGMRQRVMIAMALACKPDLLIADEPTTALDVTIERQILALIEDLRSRIGAAIILITHNLALAAEHCETIAVMYAGRIVEMAPARKLFDDPLHPYTRSLLASMPDRHVGERRLQPVSGQPPLMVGERSGCSFAPRCPRRMDRCASIAPRAVETEPGRLVECLLHDDENEASR